MSNAPERTSNSKTSSRLSIDGWAVAIALFLALLVWSGAITRVPW
jgi:hypothetical protein